MPDETLKLDNGGADAVHEGHRGHSGSCGWAMFPAYCENNRFGRRDSEACSCHENTTGLTRLPIKAEEGHDRIQFVGQIHVVHSVTKTLSRAYAALRQILEPPTPTEQPASLEKKS